MRIIIYIIVVILFPLIAFSTIKITGVVVDSETGAPLSGAHMQILNTNYMTVSDPAGIFSIADISAGNYTLSVSYLGYERWEQKVIVHSEGIVHLHIALKAKPLPLEDAIVEVPSSVARVYDSANIRATSTSNLADFLQTVGEVVILDGGGAQSARVSLRGSKPEQVSVFLDGHLLNDPCTGDCELKSITLANIDKVIVKPNSDISQGAITPGGIIELFTGERKNKSLTSSAGSFGFRSVALNLCQAFIKHSFYLSYSRVSALGDFHYRDANEIDKIRLNDDSNNQNLYLKYAQNINNREISTSYYIRLDDRGAPGGIENPATLDRIAHCSNGFNLQYQCSRSEWIRNIRAGYFDNYSENRSYLFWSGDTLYFPSRYRIKTWEFDAKLNRNKTENMIVLGASFRKDKVASSNLHNATDRDNIGIYMQRALSWKKIHFSSGVRSDFYRGYGSFISCSNSLKWRALNFLPINLFGNWNRGFNLPTFNELFWAENVFSAPNPDLKPERSQSFDIGTEFNHTSCLFRATAFQKDIKDLIVWQESYTSSGKKWKPFNNDVALIKGLELFGKYSNKFIEITTSLALSDPRNRSSEYYNNFLVFQPRMQSNEAIVLKLTPWEFRLSHRYFSRRYTLPANTKWVASANIYNSVALVEFPLNGWKIRLSAGIDNLFDQEYFIITESPMPGRSYRLEASFEM